jgi:hypothetical protein
VATKSFRSARRTILALAAIGTAAGVAAPAHAAGNATVPCTGAVAKGVVPVWARNGFSDAKPVMPQVLGRGKQIDAIVFGDPLVSPPLENRSNKILWVSRIQTNGAANLIIRAQRMQGTRTLGAPVTRSVVGGPGPSIIDLPMAGCWRLSLRWAGHSDTLDLRYRPRA